MSKKLYKFNPDWLHTVLPCEDIIERMNDLNLSKNDFQNKMGYSSDSIDKLLKSEVSINKEIALKLEKVLDIPSSFWLNSENSYRQALAEKQEKENLTKDDVDWLKQIPRVELL